MDPRLSFVAEQYGLSPFQVLNRQLRLTRGITTTVSCNGGYRKSTYPAQQRLLTQTPHSSE